MVVIVMNCIYVIKSCGKSKNATVYRLGSIVRYYLFYRRFHKKQLPYRTCHGLTDRKYIAAFPGGLERIKLN